MTRILFAAVIALHACHAGAQMFKLHRETYRVGPNPSAIAAGDLTGDGKPEILTADRGQLRSPQSERPGNNEISLLIAEGDLEYKYLEPLQAGFGPYDLTLVEMDDRPGLDIVTVSFVDNRQSEPQRDISLFHNIGDELFERTVVTIPDDRLTYRRMPDADGAPMFTTPGLTALAVHDMNGDGLLDVVAAAWSSDVVAIVPGDAENRFGEAILIPVEGAPRDLVVSDFNGDDLPDIAVALYQSNEIAIVTNMDGTYAVEERFHTGGRFPQSIQLADFNGDSVKDIAVSHCDSDDSIVIFFGQKDSTRFPVNQEIMIGEDRQKLEREIRDIIVHDFDGDGDPDIAAACWASAEVIVLRNDGKDDPAPVKFTRTAYSFKTGRPRALCASDFNEDGIPDIAVALWEENAVALLIGQAP